MSRYGAQATAHDLHHDISERRRHIELAPQHRHQAHRGIEMRAGDRCEDGDDHEQHRAGGKRVAEQRDGPVSARKLRRHDAGADDGHHQNAGPQRFRRQAAGQIETQTCLPRISAADSSLPQQQPPPGLGAAPAAANGIDVPQPGKIP